MRLFYEQIDSPVGPLTLIGDESALYCLDFSDSPEPARRRLARRLGPIELQEKPGFGGHSALLNTYFDGDPAALERVPAHIAGTPFQVEVWQALRRVRPGETVSYSELAARLGKPGAARAVGMANHRNPLALIVPCHRVVGADGSLTGYAAGLEKKRWLLDHEAAGRGEQGRTAEPRP